MTSAFVPMPHTPLSLPAPPASDDGRAIPTPVASAPAPALPVALETPLVALEGRLAALGEALQAADAADVDRAAQELQRALAVAVEQFRQAARGGKVPAALRHRLARAGAQVAAQREAIARANASLDRAIDVLLPRSAPMGLYSSGGAGDRVRPAGGTLA